MNRREIGRDSGAADDIQVSTYIYEQATSAIRHERSFAPRQADCRASDQLILHGSG